MSTFALTDEFTSFDQHAVIKVCGIGGGGGNAINRMIAGGMRDVEFININTDAQALKTSPAGTRLQIGLNITGGLGSGARPEVGQRSAVEDRQRLAEVLSGADMVFITAGLGGGTGTGASPVVAEIAKESGALTVAIVTLPFVFEGSERMANALQGLGELEQHVDTLIVVPNDRVAALCQSNMSLLNAFRQADEVLHNGVRAISELITVSGLINLDFADVRTIMQARGRALMGIGRADGDRRAIRAAEEAIICPLLEQSNIHGARGVIVNINGGSDITMKEVQEAVTTIQKAAHPDANIIFGAVVDDQERPELQVTVIAAGFPAQSYVSDKDNVIPFPEIPLPPLSLDFEPTPATPQQAATEPRIEELTTTRGSERVEYLFPEEETAQPAQRQARSEPEEDLGIPAFMRRKSRS